MAKPVTILVTGFGSFDGIGPGNLSYSTVTTLPTSLPPTPTSRTPVRILVHPYDIPVSNSEIRDIVPRLYDAYGRDVDIWLHLGVRLNQDSYSIEQQSHRDCFRRDKDDPDAPLDGNDESPFDGCPEVLETTLDFDDVFARWRSKLLDTPEASSELGGVMIRQSRTPGSFICDRLYYASLAEHWLRKKEVLDGERPPSRLPVLLMNVPTKNNQEELRRARHVTVNLLRALAESWKQKKNL